MSLPLLRIFFFRNLGSLGNFTVYSKLKTEAYTEINGINMQTNFMQRNKNSNMTGIPTHAQHKQMITF